MNESKHKSNKWRKDPKEGFSKQLGVERTTEHKARKASASRSTVPLVLRPLIQQAQSAAERYQQTNDLTMLDTAAAIWQRIWEHPAFATADMNIQLTARNTGAGVFLARYWAQGDIHDLTLALSQWEMCVQATPPDAADLPMYLTNLGIGLRERYMHTGALADLECAIDVCEQAVQATSSNSPDFSTYLNNLGHGLYNRYAHTGVLADLERAIRIYEDAVQATPPGDSGLSIYLNNLGLALRDRYTRTGAPADLERAINMCEQAVQVTYPSDPNLTMYHNNLGLGLRDRYARTGSLADLKRVINLYEQAVLATPSGAPILPICLNNLGNGLLTYYRRMGVLEDLERAIDMCEQAVQMTLPSDLNLPMYLTNLGSGLHNRYRRTGVLADLERAIRIYEDAVQTTPPGTPGLPIYLYNLGSGLRDRYAHTGVLADLERAIDMCEQAVQVTYPSDPNLTMYLNDLGLGLHNRYMRTGELGDLERAIGIYGEVIQSTSPGSPDLTASLTNLGSGLCDRYARTGAMVDLERAIKVYEKAVQATPPGDPNLSMYLTNLGRGLHDRYKRTGAMDDLESAVAIFQKAVQATPPGAPNLPMYLANLGNGLLTRYERTGAIADLDRVIDVCEQVVHVTPSSAPNLPMYLTSLGNGLYTRYKHTGRLADLKHAIDVCEHAVQATPPGVPNLPKYLVSLGNGLYIRYEHIGRLVDLERAIEIYEKAVQVTSPGSSDLAMYLNNLGLGLRDRYTHTHEGQDRKQAMDSWERACQSGMEISLEGTLHSARNWGHFAVEQAWWSAAVNAYNYGIRAIERLYRAQLRRASKESWLWEARGVPAGAAYAYAKLGQWREALLALEQGRARLLSEVLERDRADLDALQGQAPEIYVQYRAATDKLQVLEAQDVSGTSTLPPGQTLADALRAARADLDAAIEVVRTVRGYEDFLAPPDWKDIQAALVTEQPLVPIIVTSAGALALVVAASLEGDEPTITPVWLDTLTENVLQEYIRDYTNAYFAWRRDTRDITARTAWFTALDEICEWLKITVMQPIVDELHAMDVTRAVLIPTDLLGLLPLHAAGAEVGEVVFVYAANARALAASCAQSVKATNLLAIDNPDGSLRFSDEEVKVALDAFPTAQRRHLLGDKATLSNVQDALVHHNVWHFSTHGWAGWNTPLEGGLLLAGGERLTLRDLLQLEGIQARLAVLSACETGIPGIELPDEVVSLPTGLLQAGVAGVVGSLWAVNDFSTALLMMRFYEAWRTEGQAPPVALHTAQRWLRESTNADFQAYFKAQLPEFGGAGALPHKVASSAYQRFTFSQDKKARPFAHPFYWAGFYYTGV